jgi:uncharacterized protein
MRIIFYSLLMIGAVLSAEAQQKTKKTKAAKDPKVNSLLWEVSGNGLSKPSYIFGTMHMLCEDDAVLGDGLKAIIKDCEEIYFELNMENMMAEMGVAMQALSMKDNKKLSDLLTKEEYERVKRYFSTHKSMMPLSMMERFKPAFIAATLMEGSMGCSTTSGMELQVMKENKKYKKPVHGLETVAFQLSVFDSIPYDKQAKDLVASLDSMESGKKKVLELVEVYKSEDLDRIDALTANGDPSVSSNLELLLYKRNRDWAEKIPQLMKEKSCIFAVGAAHIAGDKGILVLLRNMGYKVRAINRFEKRTPGQAYKKYNPCPPNCD